MSIIRIKLDNLKFYSYIGVFDQERKVGNEYVVDIYVEYPGEMFVEERLDTTISYADVYEIVKKEMSKESLLLESVARRISETLIQRWPQIVCGKICIEKESVPVAGINGKCGIEYLF